MRTPHMVTTYCIETGGSPFGMNFKDGFMGQSSTFSDDKI